MVLEKHANLRNRYRKIVFGDTVNYNKNKCGVDKLDQLIKEFRPSRTTRRWPCVIFFDLLAFAAHASWVIYCLKNPESNLTKRKTGKSFYIN